MCATAIGGGSAAHAQPGDVDQGPSEPSTSVSEVVVTGVRPLLGDKLPSDVQDAPQSVNVAPTS